MSILSKVWRSPRAKTGGSGRPAAVADQRIVKSGNVGRNWLDRQHLDFTRIRDFGHFSQLCGHWAYQESRRAIRTGSVGVREGALLRPAYRTRPGHRRRRGSAAAPDRQGRRMKAFGPLHRNLRAI